MKRRRSSEFRLPVILSRLANSSCEDDSAYLRDVHGDQVRLPTPRGCCVIEADSILSHLGESYASGFWCIWNWRRTYRNRRVRCVVRSASKCPRPSRHNPIFDCPLSWAVPMSLQHRSRRELVWRRQRLQAVSWPCASLLLVGRNPRDDRGLSVAALVRVQ